MAVLAVSSCSPFGATQLLPTRAGEIVTKAKSMAAVMFSVYFFIFFLLSSGGGTIRLFLYHGKDSFFAL